MEFGDGPVLLLEDPGLSPPYCAGNPKAMAYTYRGVLSTGTTRVVT